MAAASVAREAARDAVNGATESLDAFDLDAVSVEPLPPPAPSPAFEALDESIAAPARQKLPWIVAGGLGLVAIAVVAAFWIGGGDTPPIVAANASQGIAEPPGAPATERDVDPTQPVPGEGSAPEPTPSSTAPTDAPVAEEPTQPVDALEAEEPGEPATEPAGVVRDARGEPPEPDEQADEQADQQTDQQTDEEPEGAEGSSTDRVRELVSTGNFFRGRAQWDRARRAYETALRSSPRNGPALAGLAKVALAQRRASEAVRLARTLVQVNARTAGNHVLLGDALSASGDRAGAREAWQQALRINPRHPTARARLGR